MVRPYPRQRAGREVLRADGPSQVRGPDEVVESPGEVTRGRVRSRRRGVTARSAKIACGFPLPTVGV